MNHPKPTALLLSKNEQGSSHLAETLKRYGCTSWFASSYEDACSLIGVQDFDLLLSPLMLRDGSAFRLMTMLEGSRASLFYFKPVEDDCWWLPALLRGKKCFGANAMRPSEFMVLLKEILFDIEADSSPVEQPASPSRPRTPVIALPKAESGPEQIRPVSAKTSERAKRRAAG